VCCCTGRKVCDESLQRGDEVRFQTGTDDNALKNVQGAEAEGISPADYVERVAQGFLALREALELSFDDFIKTSSDPRHKPGVDKFWAACAERGDLYRKSYAGLYCVGCELFYRPDELADGRCPEHATVPEMVEENNWFFRLSSYQQQLHDLTSYITAPGYGTNEENLRCWWHDADERVHVIGKGIIRFHAVYWPAMLPSAGVRLPDKTTPAAVLSMRRLPSWSLAAVSSPTISSRCCPPSPAASPSNAAMAPRPWPSPAPCSPVSKSSTTDPSQCRAPGR
jgi:methionyl-tRNA synthetase